LRIELRPRGVDVGVAYFSWIDTEIVRGADEHRDFAVLRGALRGPLAKTHPVEKAADAAIRGIERRARWVAFPGWIRAMILARGIVPLVTERQLASDAAEFDRVSAAEAARLGERASAPVGAGGDAAVRAKSSR
jgi:short-subunit dehydrogenase